MDRAKKPAQPKPKYPDAPFNPDGISSEKPKDRAKYERKFNLPPQNNSGSKRRPPVKKK
jgi:hypothetical protein